MDGLLSFRICLQFINHLCIDTYQQFRYNLDNYDSDMFYSSSARST